MQPPTFPYPTFIKVTGYWDRISIARLDNRQIVYTIVPSQTPHRAPVFQAATRAPNGDLLVYRVHGRGQGSWRDVRTGVMFPGFADAQVSPDGSRLADTSSYTKHPSLDQYDFTTGRPLNRIAVAPRYNDASILGFGWQPDSQSLLVSIGPYIVPNGPLKGFAAYGGITSVDRDAKVLPVQLAVAANKNGSFVDVYGWPAMLANGHILALRYSYPDQHDAWPSTLVDVDGSAGTQHAIGDVPIEGTMSIYARGNQALISGSETIWLYDGTSGTLRTVAQRTGGGYW